MGNKRKHTILYLRDDSGQNIATECVPDLMKTFFAEIGPKLSTSLGLPNSIMPITKYLKPVEQTIFITPVTEEVCILSKHQKTTSTDQNNISMNLIKATAIFIKKSLAFICNLSFLAGIFPRKMKFFNLPLINKSKRQHKNG